MFIFEKTFLKIFLTEKRETRTKRNKNKRETRTKEKQKKNQNGFYLL